MLITLCLHLLLAAPLADNPVNIVIGSDDGEEAHPHAQALPPGKRLDQEMVLTRLSVQTALRKAKRELASGECEAAIATLEPVLAHAAGAEEFLNTLESAYRRQFVRLLQSKRVDEARLLGERLRVLSSNALPTLAEAQAGDDSESEAQAIVPALGRSDAAVEEVVAHTADRIGDDKPSVREAIDDAVVTVESTIPAKKNVVDPNKTLGAFMTQATSIASALTDAVTTGASSTIASTQESQKQDAAQEISSLGKPTKSEPEPIPVAMPKSARLGPGYVVRGKLDEESERSLQSNSTRPAAFQTLMSKAETLYQQERYVEALGCFEQAYDADPSAAQSARDHWGYCLLYSCAVRHNEWVEKENRGQVVASNEWESLSEPVKHAALLAPSLDWTQEVQRKVENRIALAKDRERRGRRTATSRSAAPAVVERPFVRNQASAIVGSWQVIESTNFIVQHRDPDLAQRVLAVAEEARQSSHRLWFGNEPLGDWSPKCTIVLFPTAQEYSHSTGVPAQSPGHSSVQNDNGRITLRKLQLRTDDPTMLDAVLPHEVTHVVLAGGFGVHAVPRWADEGMAVLTEPRDKQEAHLANLVALKQSSRGFSSYQMFTMDNYPPAPQMRDFYAHGVGICRYLVDLGGPQKLTQFIRIALQNNNYEAALRQVYGIAGMAEFEAAFDQFARGGKSQVASAGQIR